jgi:hypothetical protein
MTIQSRGESAGWLSLKAVAGVSITFTRASSSKTGTFTAVPGDTIVEQVDETGQTVRLKVRDYLVSRTDFEGIVGAGLDPERLDEFIEQVADYDRTYRTIELGGEVSRWWDKSGQVLRIHTTEISKETTTTAGA